MEQGNDDGGVERRESTRHIACFPAEVDPGQDWATTALIRDLSTTGAMLLSRVPFTVGEPIVLQLHVSAHLGPRQVSARVLRISPNPTSHQPIWPHEIAVQFDEAVLDLEGEIREIANRQSRGTTEPGGRL